MSNRSNTIDLRGSLLSALIDPNYTPMEVLQYWQEIAPVFTYQGPAPLNKDELTWDDHRMIASIKDREAMVVPDPGTGKVGDAEVLDAYCSLPLYLPKMSEANERILAFMIPDISVEDDHPLTKLKWKPAHPILLSLTRNIVYQSPYFVLGIDINPGTWGYRHLQYKAIADVFHCLHEMDGSDPVEGEIAESAGQLSDWLHEWETKEVDFHRIREELWSAAYRLVKRFSKSDTAILHEPQSSGAPHDLSVSRPGAYRPDIPVYGRDAFKHQVWMEQMHWDSPTKSRAIAYWAARKSTSQWDHFFQACMRGFKMTWPALVEVLQQPPVTPTDIERLISFLADINWPGAYEAMLSLVSLGKTAVEFVDNAIERAGKQKDDGWLEYLQYVRGILTDEGS